MKLFGLISLILGFSTLGMATSCKEKITYDITTGGKTGTYYQIGLNLAKYVAPDACIKLNVLNSSGSLDNALKLNSKNNIKFAIVQNDVLQELKKKANEGNKKAARLVKNLRVLWPLYNEEIHILASVKSNIKTFADLKGKRINIGKKKSGNSMTSILLYKELFGKNLKNFEQSDINTALKHLIKEKSIDAIIMVAGQPVERLSKDMAAGAKNVIRLLSYSENSNQHNKVTSYYKATIKAKNYPWLDEDTQTLSTKAYLVTYDYKNQREKKYIKQFINALKNKLPILKETSSNNINTPHPKWKEVSTECAPKLPGGWKYFSAVEDICGKKSVSMDISNCDEESKVLGICPNE